MHKRVNKTLAFIHIPKTAGTSFRTLLCNLFSDQSVIQIKNINDQTPELLARYLTTEKRANSAISGHIPFYMLNKYVEDIWVFTMLRDPVERVISLYYFLKTRDPSYIESIGLKVSFTPKEFLESNHPEIVTQINNGMARFLSGSDTFYTSGNIVANADEKIRLFNDALSNLSIMEFGIVESTEQTMDYFLAITGCHLDIKLPVENIRTLRMSDLLPEDVEVIIGLNTVDILLYKTAYAEFYRRYAKVLNSRYASVAPYPINGFFPSLNKSYSILDIPGRSGFYSCDGDSFAWSDQTMNSTIRFSIDRNFKELRLQLYLASPNISAKSLRVTAQPAHNG